MGSRKQFDLYVIFSVMAAVNSVMKNACKTHDENKQIISTRFVNASCQLR